jgi:hypothetical protein
MHNFLGDEWEDGPSSIDGTIFNDTPPSETTAVRIEHVWPRHFGLSSIGVHAICGSCSTATRIKHSGEEILLQLGEPDCLFGTARRRSFESYVQCPACGYLIRYLIAPHEMKPQSIVGAQLLANMHRVVSVRHAAGAPNRAKNTVRQLARDLLAHARNPSIAREQAAANAQTMERLKLDIACLTHDLEDHRAEMARMIQNVWRAVDRLNETALETHLYKKGKPESKSTKGRKTTTKPRTRRKHGSKK